MGNSDYDAIIVGARCAGSPTAMLLAQQGLRVLLVDRHTFPSDTLSTHLIHPAGVAYLKRWGLVDGLIDTGAPPIDSYTFDFGPVTISGRPHSVDGCHLAYAPRRTLLDDLLVQAAVRAGAEVWQGFTVHEILTDDGAVTGIRGSGRDGRSVLARADLVVGADGRNSVVAKAVRPHQYNQKPKLSVAYYTYWEGLDVEHFEAYIRPDRGWAAWPTNEGRVLTVLGWPYDELEANRQDIEGNVLASMELAPSFARRVRRATRVEPFRGGAMPNVFRKPYGRGWALAGDAGFLHDPITAQGMTDAFRDAELLTTAMAQHRAGRPYDVAMAEYQQTRDAAVGAMYEFTADLARMEPPPPEMQALIGAMAGNPTAMNRFVSAYAGSISPGDFFAPANVGAILAAA
jgi:2-polyprenyl-6-methoxyphenol hydroxylase-like FAD-dependent oxidoreductase